MPSLMIQGTASSVGKSLLTAALCRILKQDGISVVPFKSQNMSLNSYVTIEGLEIGRAQALQATASGLLPSVKMNPILLKPTSDKKSQVIVLGKVIKNYDAAEYYKYKNELIQIVADSYKSLASEYDVVLIEGAGSPAEINLNKDDFVNMGMADIANSKVLLVGDIDRGGVFASIYGTVKLLETSHQSRIKGLIINKFRGDKSLLGNGLIQLENLVNIPVIGVVPYKSFLLDDEDSAIKFREKNGGRIKVRFIRLPKISNFTDADAFYLDDDVSVKFIGKPEEILDSDILVIPGSKNTIEDIRWLKKSGFAEAIKQFQGTLVGICGGYQMLGRKITDPYGVECNMGESEEGLSLLDLETFLLDKKVTTIVEGVAFDKKIYGYEIHAGETAGSEEPFSLICQSNGSKSELSDGSITADNRIFGTYIHGIFDSGEFRAAMLNNIRFKKGLPLNSCKDLRDSREQELDNLADHIRGNLDIQYIYKLIRGKND